MMRPKSVAGRQRAEGAAPVAAEPRGAEGVGDRRVAVADQQRALERQRHPLDDAPGPRLDRLEVGELVAQARRSPRRGAASVAGGLADLGEEGLERPPGSRTIARSTSRHWTLPEPSQIEFSGALAVQARHPRLLDVAVAAEALERLAGVRHGARLQIQYLSTALASRLNWVAPLVAGDRLRRRRGPAAAPPIVAASDSIARSASTFRISGWSISSLPNAERCAAWWIACATPARMPGGGAEHAVEPGVVDHLDDRRHAAALLADHPRPGAAELDLARGVRAVAELVLEPLDVERGCARRRA